jgi:hypothetical protein
MVSWVSSNLLGCKSYILCGTTKNCNSMNMIMRGGTKLAGAISQIPFKLQIKSMFQRNIPVQYRMTITTSNEMVGNFRHCI